MYFGNYICVRWCNITGALLSVAPLPSCFQFCCVLLIVFVGIILKYRSPTSRYYRYINWLCWCLFFLSFQLGSSSTVPFSSIFSQLSMTVVLPLIIGQVSNNSNQMFASHSNKISVGSHDQKKNISRFFCFVLFCFVLFCLFVCFVW